VERDPVQVRLAAQQRRMGRVRRVDRHAERPLAPAVLQRGADRHEVVAAPHQHGSGTAGEVGELVAGVVVVVQRDPQLQQSAVRLVEREGAAELVAEHLEEALDEQAGGLVVGVDRLRHRRPPWRRPRPRCAPASAGRA
jgi:hypothetical protein